MQSSAELTQDLFRKRLQPVGTSIQKGIRKRDIRCAISCAQIFDTGSRIVRDAVVVSPTLSVAVHV